MSRALPRSAARTLFEKAFAVPRDPRSDEYKAGVLAALEFRCDGKPITCPYSPASAQSDAFYAGTNEGHAIWHQFGQPGETS